MLLRLALALEVSVQLVLLQVLAFLSSQLLVIVQLLLLSTEFQSSLMVE